MLDSTLKRHIKLLTERYQHEIAYDNEKILLSSDKNQVVIESHNKHTISLSYNSSETASETLQMEKGLVYDFLIQLFERYKPIKIECRRGALLEWKDFINEERIARRTIPQLKQKWISSGIDYMDLGGNRIQAQFYKGVIILTDDLNKDKANVIEISVTDL